MSEEKTISLMDVRTGDLLCWSRNRGDRFSDLLIRGIGVLTNSKFGHVGVAWRCHDGVSDELLVVEATIPKIHISRATTDREFYCVPMNVEWGTDNKAFLMSTIGLSYSLGDAWNAFIGAKLDDDDNRYQCAELAHTFYKASGMDLGDKFRPKDVIASAMSYTGSNIYRVSV